MAKHKGDELKLLIVQQVLKGKTVYSLSDKVGACVKAI